MAKKLLKKLLAAVMALSLSLVGMGVAAAAEAPSAPGEGEGQWVYVYINNQTPIEGANVNATGEYYTMGKIWVPGLSAPTSSDTEESLENYQSNQEALQAALEAIERYTENGTGGVDLSGTDWYTLHAANGADDLHATGTLVWHLDGRLSLTSNPDDSDEISWK